MQLKIIKGDISTIECDAIVCSTSLNLSPMGQIDTAIHQKAGIDFTKFCTKVIGHCDTGKCVVTNGYNLPCKYVIHTVAPFSHVDSAAHILANCYREAIEQAIYKECSSVAFPLLGSGGKGFTVKKAIDVALNCFEVCMRNKNSNLTISFVLFDDEAKDMAIARAKEIIQPQNLELDLDSSDKSVLDKRWISLCRVNRPDKNNNIWMWRIADSINGTLIIPAFDENKEQISDNRFFIFHEDGPSTADIIGFWEWKERKTEDGRWHSDSRYIDQETPIEIYIMDTLSTVTEVVDLLRSGIHIPAYLRNRVLFAIQKDTTIEGVLCDLSDFNCRPGNEVYISLKSNIYTLNRAGQSLAEALRLAACKELDIEFTELVTGFRIRQNQNGVFIDIYLYDSLSSGAGYAVSIESSIQELLRKTRDLLSGCTCDSACHKCLKHYRNQYIHGSLDRKAALDLLEWGSNGERTPAIPYQKQQYMLRSLAQILQLSGVTIHLNQAPIEAEGRYSKKKVVVYPSMWAKPSASNTIFVSDSYLKYAKPYAVKTIVDNL